MLVAGATGYIGRSVVRELVAQGIPTAALVRSFDMPEKTAECLRGATSIQCDVLDAESTKDAYSKFKPSSTICCLASRSGVKLDAWAVDYGGGLNLLQSQEFIADTIYSQQERSTAACNFVLLSAFCVGKPLLQFQFAKLKLEDRIRQSPTVSHSIVRPTAFFKSLDGQVETVRKGLPVLYFGDGSCAANAICERDLARYLIDCALRAKDVDMVNASRDIGGPDVPPITKREQIELIYDTLAVPQEKRVAVSLPIEIFDVLIFVFSQLESFFQRVKAPSLRQRFEDAAEIARIVRYYATEPMVSVFMYVC